MFSSKGVSADPDKVKAILEIEPPTNTRSLRSFLGIVSYCAKFIPNFSTLSEPLRQVLRKNVKFHWSSRHQEAFDQLKQALSEPHVLTYLIPRQRLVVLLSTPVL